ncbi:hypothetical protein OB955_23980 [Halobacteria archaeon AArc-m2/3/4]|uniref:Uncharacterized protein n=1 Tax=Natronoglomus mannanivorans TaxID=2979990 RepID=A0ABT2QLD3_9EURY|nr:hypothetical protein [Halobacteria archaeon AArc-m2/3/4]
MNPEGILIFIFGLSIVVFPEKLVRVFFLGMLKEGALSGSGKLFYRLIGSFFMLLGVRVTVSI